MVPFKVTGPRTNQMEAMTMKSAMEMLKQVWDNTFTLPWEAAFIVDGLPGAIALNPDLTPEEKTAMLNLWHTEMIKAINEAMEHCHKLRTHTCVREPL